MDDDEPVTSGYMSWDDDRRARFDDARARAAAAIAELCGIEAEAEYPTDPPYVQGWIIAAEWTNVDLERTNQGGRHIFSPQGQMLSVGEGLADWARTRHL